MLPVVARKVEPANAGGVATTLPVVPVSRLPIGVRLATASDLAFIDDLQKKHTKMVGWMPTKQIEGKIASGDVLIAEEATERRSDGATKGDESCLPSVASSLRRSTPLGYVISRDQYMKRDDVGIIYQLNVAPAQQRNLIGASLIKAVFERAAYGCRLFCCWCAQDIAANYFWESIGFVPLAFRTGSRGKQRIHIFWQRRVREGDTSTPWWFPSLTNAGAIREDRLVFPIPPGVHWKDVMPVVLPGVQSVSPVEKKRRALPSAKAIAPLTPANAAMVRSQSKHLQGLPAGKVAVLTGGRIRYIQRAGYVAPPESADVAKPKREKIKEPKQKNDPKHIAAARELRDRYLEQVNERPYLLSQGKYDVSRAVADTSLPMPSLPALPAA